MLRLDSEKERSFLLDVGASGKGKLSLSLARIAACKAVKQPTFQGRCVNVTISSDGMGGFLGKSLTSYSYRTPTGLVGLSDNVRWV